MKTTLRTLLLSTFAAAAFTSCNTDTRVKNSMQKSMLRADGAPDIGMNVKDFSTPNDTTLTITSDIYNDNNSDEWLFFENAPFETKTEFFYVDSAGPINFAAITNDDAEEAPYLFTLQDITDAPRIVNTEDMTENKQFSFNKTVTGKRYRLGK